MAQLGSTTVYGSLTVTGEINGGALNQMMLKIYPVGAVYISTNSTSPASLFGGTWEQIQNRFLLACGSSYPAGQQAGEATHTLSVDEMPSHNHSGSTGGMSANSTGTFGGTDGGIQKDQANFTIGNATSTYVRTFDGNGKYPFLYKVELNLEHTHSFTTESTGGGQAHNNMPPYLAVYVWKRTA